VISSAARLNAVKRPQTVANPRERSIDGDMLWFLGGQHRVQQRCLRGHESQPIPIGSSQFSKWRIASEPLVGKHSLGSIVQRDISFVAPQAANNVAVWRRRHQNRKPSRSNQSTPLVTLMLRLATDQLPFGLDANLRTSIAGPLRVVSEGNELFVPE
jgi:hypothetical protein